MKFQIISLLLVAVVLPSISGEPSDCSSIELRRDCKDAAECKLKKKGNGKLVCVDKPTAAPTVSAKDIDCGSMGRKKCKKHSWACGLDVTKKGSRVVDVHCYNLVTNAPTTSSPTVQTAGPTVPTGSPTTASPTAPTSPLLCGEDTYQNAKTYCQNMGLKICKQSQLNSLTYPSGCENLENEYVYTFNFNSGSQVCSNKKSQIYNKSSRDSKCLSRSRSKDFICCEWLT